MSWVHEELATLDLGDARRDARAVELIETMFERPSGSIPQTFVTPAEVKAAYRALSSEAFAPEAFRQAQRDACVERLADTPVVLAVQDTSGLDYTDHPAMAGRGQLPGPKQWGFLLHSVLAVSDEGVPLGLLHQKTWARDPAEAGSRHQRKERPVDDKESFRWIESLRAVHAAVPATTRVVHVADREADIYEVFAEPRPSNAELLIRAAQDRRVSGPRGKLWATVEAAPAAERFTLCVTDAKTQAPRDAVIEVRFCVVELRPPTHGAHAPDLAPVTVTAVRAREVEAPEGVRAIEWLLLTTLAVATPEEARRIVSHYGLRWLIERYHYVLKSGCRIEESQLRDVERLERLLALYSFVAWRLLWLTYAARQDNGQPCTVAFTNLEWRAAYAAHHRHQPLPTTPPSLREVIRWTARLGGFLNRRGDGEPGVKALWRGLMRLHDIILGALIFSPQLVGNG
jgi:hypothetical protein